MSPEGSTGYGRQGQERWGAEQRDGCCQPWRLMSVGEHREGRRREPLFKDLSSDARENVAQARGTAGVSQSLLRMGEA